MVRAIPGGVGILIEEALVYVSPEFASIVGREAETLTGEEWRTLVGSVEAERAVHDALETARTNGYWTGPLQFDQGATVQQIDATLSAFPGDDAGVLWVISERDSQRKETIVGNGPIRPQREVPQVSLTLARAVFDSIDDVVYVINEDGEFSYWNDQLVETTGYSHEEIQSMHPSEFIPRDQHEFVPGLLEAIGDIRDRRVEVDLLTKDGKRITHEFSGTTFEEPGTNQVYRCGIARDITERLERERELARHRDKLATLNRINDLLFETARELIQTGNRAAVEKAVCDQLVSSELYDSVWIGERELDGDGLVTRVSAGVESTFDPDTLDGEGQTDTSIVSKALQTGAVEVAHSGDSAVAEWETATGRRGVASLIAVPLQHGETVYSVLLITTTRENAFGPREQAGFEAFGRLLGVVVHAARSRELLFADTVVELEFDFSKSDLPFADAANALNCQLTLDGYVHSQEGWVMYLTVENAPPGKVATELAKDGWIDHARRISGERKTGRIEVGVSAPTVLQVASDAGATVQRARVTPETARFVVETPIDTDVRWLVERMTDAFPSSKLLATRKCDRKITTVGRPGGLLNDLTDRQREVLEAAYQAGYFSWPRESTAEEVAESLGLASATLHGHLRKAESVILSGLLDER
jgi:PAS domain S-box-containing protein